MILSAFQVVSGTAEDLFFAAKRIALGAERVRRTRLYCVGLGKSGTHSVVEMFSKNVRAAHEPQAIPLMDKIIEWRSGRLNESALRQWVRQRDRELALEIDSSMLNFDILEILLAEFPDARFLLTIRDCYSWLNSLANHRQRFAPTADPRWARTRELRYGPDPREHAPEELVLKEAGLSTLDHILSFWSKHALDVIARVPERQLLIVRTDQLGQKAFEIADFAKLPRRTVRLRGTHAFQAQGKQELIRKIDPDFLERSVDRHCRPLMTRFFPEIKSLDDAKL